MNVERFIASRLARGKASSFTRPVIRIGVLSIALGMALMILSVAIVTGFQRDIRDKIIGINGHIQIGRFKSNTLMHKEPVDTNREFLANLPDVPGIRHFQCFANKAGIVKSGEETEGAVLKGTGTDYDWRYLSEHLVDGELPVFPDSSAGNEILVSSWLATRLFLVPGDKLFMFFVENPRRPRAFIISGIYQTGLEEEIDKQFLFGDIRHVQVLNNWLGNQVEGFEVFIDDFRNLEELTETVYQVSDADLSVTGIHEEYPQIFDWLELLDMNVIIILFLMILVAGVNMISTLLILILEKTRMVGILKSIGARNFSVRRVFLYLSARMVFRGLVFGNILGIGLGLIQFYFRIIPLDPASYYMTTVPIHFNLLDIGALNAGSFIIIIIMLLLPLWYIQRISPASTIRFN